MIDKLIHVAQTYDSTAPSVLKLLKMVSILKIMFFLLAFLKIGSKFKSEPQFIYKSVVIFEDQFAISFAQGAFLKL